MRSMSQLLQLLPPWRGDYKSPPPGWSIRPLSSPDCSQFGCNATPIVAWVVDGEVDVEKLSDSLRSAIRRRAPWVGGRLAKTQSGNVSMDFGIMPCRPELTPVQPHYEIHVPPVDSDVTPATHSVVHSSRKLSEIISYIPRGIAMPFVSLDKNMDPKVLNPQSVGIGAIGYISRGLTPLHLHFIKAADVTLISISWSHAIMDAVGLGEIIQAWQEEINGSVPDLSVQKATGKSSSVIPLANDEKAPSRTNPNEIFSFTDGVKLDPSWAPPSWIKFGLSDLAPILFATIRNRFRYPPEFGCLYVPKTAIDSWKSNAEKELGKDRWLSTHDLLAAWISKYAWETYPDDSMVTLAATINFRGRHPCLPRTLIANNSTSYVVRPYSAGELHNISVSQLGVDFRKRVELYNNPDYVANEVAFEFRRIRDANGARTMYPCGAAGNHVFILCSWAKMGIEEPNFGNGTKVLCPILSNADGLKTMIPDGDGGWRIFGWMSNRSWESLREQIKREFA